MKTTLSLLVAVLAIGCGPSPDCPDGNCSNLVFKNDDDGSVNFTVRHRFSGSSDEWRMAIDHEGMRRFSEKTFYDVLKLEPRDVLDFEVEVCPFIFGLRDCPSFEMSAVALKGGSFSLRFDYDKASSRYRLRHSSGTVLSDYNY